MPMIAPWPLSYRPILAVNRGLEKNNCDHFRPRIHFAESRHERAFKLPLTIGSNQGLSIIEQDPSKGCQRCDI
jgi:hypothetical protein